MQLYLYEHCPFCVRVLMLIKAKRLAVECKVILNDDVETPTSLIGQKMVPILITDDGKAMPESLDIIHYLDHLREPLITDTSINPAIQTWLNDVAPINRQLIYPRMVQHPFPEFNTESARDYFIHKKFGDHAQMQAHLDNTDMLAKELNTHWPELEAILSNWDNKALCMTDIILFPVLRNMSLYSELNPPAAVKHYMDRLAESLSLGLYW